MNEDKRIEDLRSWGCDIDGALERTLNDKEFYISLIEKYKDSFELDQLYKAVNAKQTSTAFEYAHSLKGVIGNLGLSPMYEIIVKIVELLRTGCGDGISEYVEDLIEKKSELDAIFS